MSRFNPNRNVVPVLAAAQQWIQEGLIEERSLLSDRPLWTPGVLEEVRVAFTDNPDDGESSFSEKLEGQMRLASDDAKCLMAELLWVLMLFQSNIGPAKKRESIQRVWAWSGRPLDISQPLLADAALVGIGNPGTAYNTQRWRELNYIIGLSIDLAARPREERMSTLRDRDRFESWIVAAPQEGYRQFRHIFRYLAFPDQNERITLNRDRRLILETFTDLDPKVIRELSDAAQDDALSALRERLKGEYGKAELDFYEPQIAGRWRDKQQVPRKDAQTEDAFSLGYGELRERFLAQFPQFVSFATEPGYIEHERGYKDELVELFHSTVSPLLEAEDWQAAGAAAVALLKVPLKSNSGNPQNIVGWRYVDALRHLDAAGREAFAQALAALLDDSAPFEPRVDAFVHRLSSFAGQAFKPGAQRSIVSFYLTLSNPRRHLFLKTDEMRRALRKLDPTFGWNSSRLTGADAREAEALARRIFERLQLEGWEPKDLLDVQGFLWVATAYGKSDVEEGAEDEIETEPMPKHASDSRQPLNQILFGPPGTGKTYETVVKALDILDPVLLSQHGRGREARPVLKRRFDELVDARRIRFLTFHQSFSYEDFVEGLRADTDQAGNLSYRVEPGVFKAICDDARGAAQVASSVGIRDGARIWKLSIDGTGPSATRDHCFANDEARIGWGEAGDLRDEGLSDRSAYQQLGSNDRNTLHAFANEMQPGDVVLCIGSSTEVQAIGVVQGDYSFDPAVPPRVRKDYGNVLPVRWLAKGLVLDLRSLNGGVRFTLKTVYEISRFGWPELAEEIEAAGVQLKGMLPMPKRLALDHVLIIDEINRGNVSRIFGELITLIESSKRSGANEQLEVVLPYSKKPFSVPSNVYVIGTMNTADRSLATLDIALRRRFQFVEMPARPEELEGVFVAGIDLAALLETMNRRIEVLLDRDHTLGHAYFMSLQNGDALESLATVFRNQILPLLQEYFFEDWQRIAWVLNDHRKPAGNRFVVPPPYSAETLFGAGADVPADAKLWRLDPRAFERPESYAGIIEAAQV